LEHDDWHTHEHLPERLAIPGFVRGTRWVAVRGQPRYFVMYEVAELGTLVSDAYLQRLNNPTPWTAKMMPHYRGMARGLCSVVASHGVGIGHLGLLIRCRPAAEARAAMGSWLADQVLPLLPMQPGLGSVHLLEGAAAAEMTNEQRIRGADAGVDWAVLVTGYREQSLAALADGDLGKASLKERGVEEVRSALYQTAYTLTASDVVA
jgi:hypothetical protein